MITADSDHCHKEAFVGKILVNPNEIESETHLMFFVELVAQENEKR